ncbi:FdhF/YdeP family oxidoreductase [Frigoriflavimonas asaccharolytica]|uniref:Molybdopterin-dependent oxidoreductase alpha subunit n=1 Tax=Frigoriflavimonas asaccharolytica TaxID=2735899 RepID=A0A8J8K8H5_9FLAO|nr:FdhF/YdeP family oxidoreductase [Frigoriflavimonas asaccharolytica]NRS91952.1 molybdopterin-dependent oxidoreductase alpha subunit [Frigoriflavimonas asaccharolytica]
MSNNHNQPNPENPPTFEEISLEEPKKYAAGYPAIFESAKHVFGAMGVKRGMSALNSLNKMDGFDCPGCAWPDPDDERSPLGEYCENGAKAVAEEATTKVIYADFFAKHSLQEMAEWDDFKIGKSGRLAQPMYLAQGATHYQAISWKDAFQKIAGKLNGLASPNEAIFYTSGRTSNEAAFLHQLFTKAYGTNNMPDCSNMCHESSGVALGDTLGIGKGSVKLEDFYETDAIIIMGQNPGTNHPRMLTALRKARKNGAMIIGVNPMKEAGLIAFNDPQTIRGLLRTKPTISTDYLHIKINGDLPLMQAIGYYLLKFEEEFPGKVLDQNFINNETAGFEAYKKHILSLNLNELSEMCGISLEQIKDIADKLKFKNKIIICWAMGLTQHKNSVDTIKEVVNILLMKGSIGKPGAGTCPVRGHSNVQGDRTMGVYEKPWKWLLDKVEENYNFTVPRAHGFDVVESIEAMQKGEGKIFFGLGGNFLSATPDTKYTAEALQKCELTVQISTKLNRGHLITGKEAIILPTFGRSDADIQKGIPQFVTCENSMGVIQKSEGKLEPVSNQLMSEVAIICHLATEVLGEKSTIDWLSLHHDYDLIRDEIERTIPGFDKYNLRVRKEGGFYLPNSSRIGDFPTENNKANFSVSKAEMIQLKEEELLMMTIRSHDQYNTTIYGLNDRYRGVHNERRVIFMNKNDMEKRGLNKLDVVNLHNFDDDRERVAHRFLVIPYDIPETCCATYFPETNVLVPVKSVARESNTPTSKSVKIEVRKAE